MALPTDSKVRKTYPMFTGLIRYFPDALGSVANLSFETNQRHNPGEPLHWAREKSNDHDDCVVRHTTDVASAMEAGNLDTEIEERRQLAWRALAGLQLAIERKQAQQYAGGGLYGKGPDLTAVKEWNAEVKAKLAKAREAPGKSNTNDYPAWAYTPLERQAYDSIVRERGIHRKIWTTLCLTKGCDLCDEFRIRTTLLTEAPDPGRYR